MFTNWTLSWPGASHCTIYSGWTRNQIVGISRCWLVDWSSPDGKKWFKLMKKIYDKAIFGHTHCIVVILSHPHFIPFVSCILVAVPHFPMIFPFVVANPSLISQIRMELLPWRPDDIPIAGGTHRVWPLTPVYSVVEPWTRKNILDRFPDHIYIIIYIYT